MKQRYHKIKSGIKEIRDILFISKTDAVGGLAKKVEIYSGDLLSCLKTPLNFGLLVIGLFSLAFFIWGGFAPLDSASNAMGTIAVAGHQRVIQHLEGGTVSEILVSDGDHVTAGEPLLKLSAARANADLNIVKAQLIGALLIKERIVAEQSLKSEIVIPNRDLYSLIDFDDQETKHMFDLQGKLLHQRNTDFLARKETLITVIKSYEAQIKGSKERLSGVEERVKIMSSRYKDIQEVYKKSGSISEHELLDEKRKYEGEKEQLISLNTEIARLNEEKIGADSKYHALITEREVKIAEEYKENYRQLIEAEARYKALLDTLQRTVIRAPIDGVVSEMKFHTIGGVVAPSTPIMSIIPLDEQLVVDCLVPPVEIVHLRPGMKAKVQLTSYNQRLVPRIDGVVIFVSPDKVQSNKQDPSGKMPSDGMFNVRIRLDREELKRVNYNIKLLPGMPVNVFIIRGETTFLKYMLSPIVNSFHRAFTEE